ncbi:MAG: DNA polymerase III subunit gamma/tau [Candidatus Krumholzibacteriota bacterium]|nr:DNA polymerase III subunit gamma/tau [Candidatus Krumholzibacteriota bacterium]
MSGARSLDLMIGGSLMAYLVLARKWRPKRFSEVIGQDHVTLTLKKAVEKNRLAHAYLFSGPRGCGKTSTARLLAKVINCEDRKGSEPCDKCQSCLAVNDGSHLDMIEIDGASNRGIDEIRDLREKIGYAPSQGASKIYIIDEVHMLTPQAFNALLKTLEEPPQHVYMIFATTEPHKVPATILSRCQRFNFKRLATPELSGQLEKICSEEKIEADSEALLIISRSADGSMRDAESLLDQCISAFDKKIDIQTVRRVLGLVDSAIITSLLSAVSQRNRKDAFGIIDAAVSSGLDLEKFFLAYIEGVRNLIVLSVEDDSPGWLDLTSEEVSELRKVAGIFKTEDLLFLFRSASRAFREMKNSSQPRYLVEAAIAEAASWDSVVEISQLIEKIEKGGGGAVSGMEPSGTVRKGSGSGSKPSDRTKEEKPGADPGRKAGSASLERKESGRPDRKSGSGSEKGYAEFDSTGKAGSEEDSAALAALGGRDQWERFLAQVREAKLTLGIWLMSARVKSVEGEKIVLSFSAQNRFASEMVHESKNKRYIESHLERFYGRKLVIGKSSVDKNAPDIGAPEEKKEEKIIDSGTGNKQMEDLFEKSPMVRRIVEEFNGEISKDNRGGRS